jgi:hypothetical protein
MRPRIQFGAASVAAREPHQPWHLIKPLATEDRITMTGVQRLKTRYENFHHVQPKVPDHGNRTVHNYNLIPAPREPVHNHAQLLLNLARFAGASRVHPVFPVWA